MVRKLRITSQVRSKMKYGLLLVFICIRILNAKTQTIQNSFDKAKSDGFSGIVLVAENGNKIFYEATGHRNFEQKNKLKKTDIFELASVSKQFTAMIIMILKEQGKLGFDDSIEKYISIPYSGITIRHLLTHTSGLPDYQKIMDEHWDKTKIAGNQEILQYINKYAPLRHFEAGEKYEYSNTGYVILASIAEKASGKDFVDLCNNMIFKPLKMKNTKIRSLAEKAKEETFAAGHLLDSLGNFVNANKFRASDYTLWLGNRKGPGRISGTAEDLLKWDQALYTEKLVKKQTLDEAFSQMILNNGKNVDYGFGWMVVQDDSGKKFVFHTGDNPGYKTIIMRFFQDRKTLIILNNNAYGNFSNLINEISAILNK